MEDGKVGRPLKFNSVEELEEKIEAYFIECDTKEDPYTITGLALALDTTRRTLIDYENKDEYSHTIKKAKQKCENYAEKYLFNGKNTAGVIFNMKNNYGWVDKSSQELTGADGKDLVTGINVNFVKSKDGDKS